MSVQATIALLNKSATSSPDSTGTKLRIRKVSGTTWTDASDRRASTIDTTARAAELERIRCSASGRGVASMLSRFDRSDSSASTRRNTTSSIFLSHRAGISPSSSLRRSCKINAITDSSSHSSSSRLDAIMLDLVTMYKQAAGHRQGEEDAMQTTTTSSDEERERRGDDGRLVPLIGDNKGAERAARADKEGDGSVKQAVDEEELLSLRKQLRAMEQGAHSMFAQQAHDLEAERKQTRTLTEVVRKQEQLIAALQGKASSAQSDHDELLLLQEQVELQQLEIKDKRSLLTRLLDEREQLLRLLRGNPNQASVRAASADLPSSERHHHHLLSRASSPALRHMSSVRSRSSTMSSRPTSPPTLSGPPRDPLPPVPKSSFRGSSASSASTSSSSFLSPTTSWSSADYAAAMSPARLPEGAGCCGAPGDPQQPVWLDYMPADGLPPTPPGTIGRQPTFKFSLKRSSSNSSSFWKGWKHRLASRS